MHCRTCKNYSGMIDIASSLATVGAFQDFFKGSIFYLDHLFIVADSLRR